MRASLVVLILLLAAPVESRAGEAPYRCEVESIYRFADAVFLPDDQSALIGERFAVDRVDGEISGFELGNQEAEERMVLDRGSGKQAFKVLSVFEVYGPYQAVKYLYIEEFAPSSVKPFFAVSGSRLLTGHCTR